ncbi:MAG: ABC transporter substrate-binding protein [Planctomycetaceae bacterium]|nr:ABC transporter substrate-binding protein [Planctomycetaceae bacterium]
MNRTVRTICLLLVGSLLPAGCSKKNGPVSNDKVFRYPLVAKVKSMDPGNVEDVYGALIASHICESLYTYHYLKRPYVIEPQLADGMPEISDDHLTYTIKIKKGVFYQDDSCFPDGKGRELKADDFVFAFKRIANIRYVSPNWGGFKDRIVGLDAFRDYTAQFKNEFEVDYSKEVEGLRALDDYTLVIKLVKPWPQLLDDLTNVVTAPVPKEAVDLYQKDMNYHPIGTGPYYLKKWNKAVYLELAKNPNFRKEYYPDQGAADDAAAGLLAASGKPLPFIDRIIFRIIEEEQPAWLLFLRGELDVMGIPKDNFSSAVDFGALRPTEAIRQRGIQLDIYDQPSLYYIGFNLLDPVLGKNKPLRQAISLGFDRKKFNELFYNDRWTIAHGLIDPEMNEYDPNLVEAGFSAYDPQQARRLITEAEKIQGGPIPELSIGTVGGDPFSRQIGQFVQRQIQAIGLKVKVEYVDWPTYVEQMNKGDMQVFAGGGVRFNAPDALGVLQMFATKFFAPLGNSFFYSNPEYDRLYDQAEVMFPGPARTELYRRMERMVLADYPAVLTNRRVQWTLRHGWVKNFKPHPFLYGYFKYMDVDSENQNSYKSRTKGLEKER